MVDIMQHMHCTGTTFDWQKRQNLVRQLLAVFEQIEQDKRHGYNG